jgi:beta-glucanase (GH16 family)
MSGAWPSKLPLLAMAVTCACANEQPAPSAPLDLCAYELVFADEFDDLSVAPRVLGDKRWTAHTPWNGDFGDAAFSNPGPAGPFAIEDGVLRITARRDDAGRWRSGLLAAGDASGKGFGVRYGYFEARMKLPPGPGTWPAFWLMSLKPAADKRPKVEIDVIEYYGHRTDRYHVTGHVWYSRPDQDKTRHEGSPIPVADGSLVAGFHTYGVSVDPARITYYFDRQPVWQQATPPEHRTALYPLVDLALGSGYSIEDTPNPSVMEVDYVRVYRPASPRRVACEERGAGS